MPLLNGTNEPEPDLGRIQLSTIVLSLGRMKWAKAEEPLLFLTATTVPSFFWVGVTYRY